MLRWQLSRFVFNLRVPLLEWKHFMLRNKEFLYLKTIRFAICKHYMGLGKAIKGHSWYTSYIIPKVAMHVYQRQRSVRLTHLNKKGNPCLNV